MSIVKTIQDRRADKKFGYINTCSIVKLIRSLLQNKPKHSNTQTILVKSYKKNNQTNGKYCSIVQHTDNHESTKYTQT